MEFKEGNDFDPNEPNEAFYMELLEYRKEYEIFLVDKMSRKTIYKHVIVIGALIEYLCINHGVSGFEQITVSMANSRFLAWHNNHYDDPLQKVTAKNILKGYFNFIYEEHGIRNEKILKSFDKK